MTIVQFPASRLERARPAPGRCARHGQPATELHRVRIVRRPAGLLARIGGPLVAALVTLPSDPVVTPEWPFCPECREERSLRLTAGTALCVAALMPAASLVMMAPLASFAGYGTTLLVALLCAVLVATGLGLIAVASWPALSSAGLSRDGNWVLVDAHPAFAHEVLGHTRD